MSNKKGCSCQECNRIKDHIYYIPNRILYVLVLAVHPGFRFDNFCSSINAPKKQPISMPPSMKYKIIRSLKPATGRTTGLNPSITFMDWYSLLSQLITDSLCC